MTESPSFHYRRLWLPDLVWILLLVVAATLPFLSPSLDFRIMSWVYQPDLDQHPWPLKFNRSIVALYTFGTLPALFTVLIALGILVAARYRRNLLHWRRYVVFLLLTLALGPGLLVNTLFKDNWGRPRPRMVSEFRGRMDYHCFYDKGPKEHGKSFPCGHSSMGYYFVVLYFLARRRHKLLRLSLLAGAMVYGTLIGFARMAAGAHFPSDVLWSAVMPCLAAWGLYYFILKIPYHEDHRVVAEGASGGQANWYLWLVPPLAVATIAAVLLGTPAYVKININEAIPGGRSDALVELVVASPGKPYTDFCFVDQKPRAVHSGRIVITGEAQGFGWPWNRIEYSVAWSQTNGIPLLRFTCQPIGKFPELDGHLTIEFPEGTRIIRIEP